MINPLQKIQNKQLSVKDVPLLKHNCILLYGYEWWNTVGLDGFFEQLQFIQEEIAKRENLRLCTLKHYGVKNPK